MIVMIVNDQIVLTVHFQTAKFHPQFSLSSNNKDWKDDILEWLKKMCPECWRLARRENLTRWDRVRLGCRSPWKRRDLDGRCILRKFSRTRSITKLRAAVAWTCQYNVLLSLWLRILSTVASEVISNNVYQMLSGSLWTGPIATVTSRIIQGKICIYFYDFNLKP